jgi:hypothetical protein
MEQSELLRQVTRALERLGLRYFVTGSTATIFFGEPRFTRPPRALRSAESERLSSRIHRRDVRFFSGRPPPPFVSILIMRANHSGSASPRQCAAWVVPLRRPWRSQ